MLTKPTTRTPLSAFFAFRYLQRVIVAATLTRSLRIDCTPQVARPGIKPTADVANQITNPFQVVPIREEWGGATPLPTWRSSHCLPQPGSRSRRGTAHYPH